MDPKALAFHAHNTSTTNSLKTLAKPIRYAFSHCFQPQDGTVLRLRIRREFLGMRNAKMGRRILLGLIPF